MKDPLGGNVALGRHCGSCFAMAVVVVNVIALGIALSLLLFDVFLDIQLRCATTTAASELLLLLVVEEVVRVVVTPFSFVVSYDVTVAVSQLTTVGDILSSSPSRQWSTRE
jgi:hypothetical protein